MGLPRGRRSEVFASNGLFSLHYRCIVSVQKSQKGLTCKGPTDQDFPKCHFGSGSRNLHGHRRATHQPMNMAMFSSIVQALESLTKRTKFHKKVMLGILTILGLSGVTLLSLAFLMMEGTQRVVMLVGGSLLVVMTFLPYNQIQILRKHNMAIDMIAGVIDRLQGKVPSETLNTLVSELLQYSLRR